MSAYINPEKVHQLHDTLLKIITNGVEEMSRLLYSVLKVLESSETFHHEDYKIPKKEFDDFIKMAMNKGYINAVETSRAKLAVSPLGHEFLKQHKHYGLEMPLEPGELPHWVRFEGERYQRKHAKIKANSENPNYIEWKKLLEKSLSGGKSRFGESELEIADKATINELTIIETLLGMKLPEEFKDVLLHFSKRVYFFWSVKAPANACHLPNGNRRIEGGGLRDGGIWDLEALLLLNQERLDQIDMMDDDESLPYWENSFVFAKDGSGDYFAIDLNCHPGEVILLTHEDHSFRYPLGRSFGAFLDNWIKIGCSGYTVSDFQTFASEGSSYMDYQSESSKLIRKWLGIDV